MSSNDAWNTQEFVQRATQLGRYQLRDLYPSEAWSLYRILPGCERVLDLGCGNGRMAPIVQAISPGTSYLGVDSNSTLVQQARQRFAENEGVFIEADVFEFVQNCTESFDCITAWALTYALPNFQVLLDDMIALTNRWVLFDARVANVSQSINDTSLAYTQYGEVKAPYVIASFSKLIENLKKHETVLASIEMTAYHFPVGDTSWVSSTLPHPAVLSVVLERRPVEEEVEGKPTEWVVTVPPELREPVANAVRG